MEDKSRFKQKVQINILGTKINSEATDKTRDTRALRHKSFVINFLLHFQRFMLDFIKDQIKLCFNTKR